MDKKPWLKNWRIERTLGQGRQGTTEVVTSIADPSQKGVLKRLNRNRDLQARTRMRREVVALETLAKEGIKVPDVLDHNTEEFADLDVTLYFVMQYIDGKSLKEAIVAQGPASLELAIEITRDLASTVAQAHKRGVLHRDLNPDNIMVRDLAKLDLVIVDYGLSFNREDDEPATRIGEPIGNRFITLPELNMPKGNRRDHRSDIASLCCVLYFCLTGEYPALLTGEDGRPIHRSSGADIAAVLKNDPRCSQVELLLDRGLAPATSMRFQSCEELIERLDAVRTPQPITLDLASLATRIESDLTTSDRISQVHRFRQICMPVLGKLQRHAFGAANKLHPTFQIMLAGGRGVVARLPTDIDEVLGDAHVIVRLVSRNLSCRVGVVVGSRGAQCVLMRCVVRPSDSGCAQRLGGHPGLGLTTPNEQLIVPWNEVLWFDPFTLPTDSELTGFLDGAIAMALEALKSHVLTDLKG